MKTRIKKDRKSQVDVALAIGAIIIPVAALFGSLIFAFVMISQYGDAAKIAAVIAHDTVTLADVAYSVPDTITIYYQPPKTYCSFTNSTSDEVKDKIYCLNGFLNFTGIFKFETTSYKTKINNNYSLIPYSLKVSIPAFLDPGTEDILGNLVELPMYIDYSGYANLKDPAMTRAGSKSEIYFKVDDAIIVQKFRKSIFDTLDPTIDQTVSGDPLVTIMLNMLTACQKPDKPKQEVSYFVLPHNYNINRTITDNIIYLTRFHQSPLNIASTDPKYTNWSVVNSFNVNKLNSLSGLNCTFNLNNTYFNSTTAKFTEPRGNSVEVVSDIYCVAACDSDTNTPECDCPYGEKGMACISLRISNNTPCGPPYYTITTRLNATAIRGVS